MSSMVAGAVRWSCARCGVSVGRMDGVPTNLPDTWSGADGEIFCLSCSRARAGEAAMDLAPAASSHEDRNKLRRKALIEFEIGRSPDAPDRAIAQACHTSTGAVAAIRGAAVELAGAPPNGNGRRDDG